MVFVGRITRQKGLIHLVRAAEQLDADTQFVLLAGAPDTPEIAQQIGDAFAHLQSSRGNVIWIEEMLPRGQVRQVLSHATVFACPSVYEPLGIVNLEAMACETAVVASAVGGIPEVVVDGETGYLVPYDPARADDPAAVAAFEEGLATKINSLTSDPEKARSVRPRRTPALHRRVRLGQDRRRDGRGLSKKQSRCTTAETLADRTDAGRALAAEFDARSWTAPPVVLALPRGGVPVAAEVAARSRRLSG